MGGVGFTFRHILIGCKMKYSLLFVVIQGRNALFRAKSLDLAKKENVSNDNELRQSEPRSCL